MKRLKSILYLWLYFSLNLYAQPTTANQDFAVTNGTVYAIAVDGNYTYIGGSFTYVGMNTGYGIKVTANSSIPSTSFPKVNGSINCVTSDGSGGWYIGGSFTKVGSYSRNYIAHINSDGSVNTTWNPNANGYVYSIAINGSNVYVGGNFTSIGGQTRKAIAKLNNTNGNADASWNANLDNFSPTVYAIAITGSDIYIGGNFTSINSTTVNRIAKLNLSDGSRNNSWDANANNVVKKIVISGSYLFVCGDFTNIGGQSRNKIAKLNTTNGNAEAAWNANSNGAVYAIALSTDGNYLYVGGAFSNIGEESRTRLAKLSVADALAESAWNPGANHNVYSLAVTNTAVYVGGFFSNIGNADVYRFAKLNLTNGNAVSNWTPTPNTYPNDIAVYGDDIYAGGDFHSAGGKFQNYVARINNTNGKLDESWSPSGFGVVYTIELGTTYIYFGGDSFAKRFVRASGLLDGTWIPTFNSIVRTIYPDESNNAIYIGGDFTSVNSTSRNYIAKVDNIGATNSEWNPNANARVRTIILYNNYLYAGGEFINIGGQTRNYIAKLNNTNGNADTWNPSANNYIYKMALNGSNLYIGGGFNQISSQTRNRLAKYDLSTGSIDGTWNPNSDGWVYTLATNSSGSSVYVGGNFFNIGGSSSIYYLAKLNNTNGNAESWDVDCGYLVHSIVTSNDDVYAGGEFNSINNDLQPRIALFTTRLLPVELTSFTAVRDNNNIKLLWKTETEVNNYGFEIERKYLTSTSISVTNWEKIGFIKGNGNSNSPKDYSFTDENPPSGKLKYRLKQIDTDGSFSYSQEIEIEIGVPKEFRLHQNYPNPFNPTTTIEFTLAEDGFTTLKIYDILGREVATLVNEELRAGLIHNVTLNANNLSTGLYFYRLESNKSSMVKKLMFVK